MGPGRGLGARAHEVGAGRGAPSEKGPADCATAAPAPALPGDAVRCRGCPAGRTRCAVVSVRLASHPEELRHDRLRIDVVSSGPGGVRAATLPAVAIMRAGRADFPSVPPGRPRPPTARNREPLMHPATVPPQGQANGPPTDSSADARPVTVPDFLAAKARGTRLTVLTAYDYTMARLLDAAGVDGLLVGDSLGMVVQGHDTSLTVTLEEVIYHTRLVARGARRALLVADLPFMSFQVSPRQALRNAGR